MQRYILHIAEGVGAGAGFNVPFYHPIRYGNRRFIHTGIAIPMYHPAMHRAVHGGALPMASMVAYVKPPVQPTPVPATGPSMIGDVIGVLIAALPIAAVAHWGFHLAWLPALGIGFAVPAAAWLVVSAVVYGSQKGI